MRYKNGDKYFEIDENVIFKALLVLVALGVWFTGHKTEAAGIALVASQLVNAFSGKKQ